MEITANNQHAFLPANVTFLLLSCFKTAEGARLNYLLSCF